MLVGFALFGTVYILPQYLGQVQRYNAEQIGLVLAWTGLPQLLIIPLVPLLIKRFDVRYIGFVGISHLRRELFHEHHTVAGLARRPVLRAQYRARHRPGAGADADHRASPRPASLRSEAGAASGLSNMLRNLGGAVGTATLGDGPHQARAVPFEHHRPVGDARRDEVRDRIAQLTQYFMAHGVTDPAVAQHKAIAAIGATVHRQALILGFSDTFAVIGVVLCAGGGRAALCPQGGCRERHGGGHFDVIADGGIDSGAGTEP